MLLFLVELKSKTKTFIYPYDIYLWYISLVTFMDFTYKGKPILPTKTALNELSEIDVNLYEVSEILEKGFEIRKRKKSIIERGVRRGNKVINVVVVDLGDYYKLIHAGKFTLSKKFKKLMRNKNGL